MNKEAARLLVKIASRGAGQVVGKALRHAGRTAKGVFEASGDLGAGIAEGMGADAGVGKLVGQTAAVGAGAAGAGKVKRKTDEWRYRNGMYSGY